MRRFLVTGALVATVLSAGPAANGHMEYTQVPNDVAWSPDGTQLVVGDNQRLTVMNADGSGKRLLEQGEYFVQVSWAPASLITYVDDNYDLASVDPATRSVRVIQGAPAADFSVSADGQRIAFDTGGFGPCGGYCANVHVGIAAVSGGFRYLPKEDRSGRHIKAYDQYPAFSPDGKRLVLDREAWIGPEAGAAGPPNVVIEPVAGGPATPLGVSGWLPRVSPDGKWISFNGPRGLEVIPATGGKPRLLVRAPAGGLTFDIDATWSPDSTRLAVAGDGLGLQIVTLGGHRITIHAPIVQDSDPKWSPDATKLAFVGLVGKPTDSADLAFGVYTVSADGTGLDLIDRD